MTMFHIGKRSEHARLDSGSFTIQFGKQVFDSGSFQVLISTGRAGAAGDGESGSSGIADDVILGYVHEGPDHHIPAIISAKKWRHGLDLPVVEQIQKECLDEIITVVTEGYLVTSQFPRLGIEHAALKSGAERAGCIVGSQFFEHETVDRRRDYAVLDVLLPEVVFDQAGLKPRETRMDSDCDKRKSYRSSLLQALQDMKQRPAAPSLPTVLQEPGRGLRSGRNPDRPAREPPDIVFSLFTFCHQRILNPVRPFVIDILLGMKAEDLRRGL